MHIETQTITIVSNGSSVGAGKISGITGRLVALRYIKAGSGGYTDGVVVSVTTSKTGQTLWSQTGVNSSAIKYPRAAVHGSDGAAALHAADGTALLDQFRLADEDIVFALTSAGASKTGQFQAIWER